MITMLCSRHQNLRQGVERRGMWRDTVTQRDIKWLIYFKINTTDPNEKTTCDFECKAAFLPFADNPECKLFFRH